MPLNLRSIAIIRRLLLGSGVEEAGLPGRKQEVRGREALLPASCSVDFSVSATRPAPLLWFAACFCTCAFAEFDSERLSKKKKKTHLYPPSFSPPFSFPTPLKKTADSSIASVVAATPTLTTLLAAVKAANLTEKLSNSTIVTTVFAPTNDAFAAYLAKNNLTAEQLLASPDLKWILKQHFVKKAALKVSRAGDRFGGVEREREIERKRVFFEGRRRTYARARLLQGERGLCFFPLSPALCYCSGPLIAKTTRLRRLSRPTPRQRKGKTGASASSSFFFFFSFFLFSHYDS